MPPFRRELVCSDDRHLALDLARAICAEVIEPSTFFVGPHYEIQTDYQTEEIFWEVFRGRLLDGTQTRQRRRFETWGVHWIEGSGDRPPEPVLAIRFDSAVSQIFVTRAILCRTHEAYESGGEILTRATQRWQRELVGAIQLDQFATAGAFRDELACLLFHAVVGTSRLPLTSVEAPLPGYTLGQFAYWFRPNNGGGGPLTSWSHICRLPDQVGLTDGERVKHLEFLLRAVPRDDLAALAGLIVDPLEIPHLLRGVFNAVTLSPYTDFVSKALEFLRLLVERGAIRHVDRIDLLCHLVRQLARHLTAYDLVTFHHRGANYPDALFLDELLNDLVPAIMAHPELFAGNDGRPRSRRRAIRQGLLIRLEYTGHSVPDAPTSPGENLRILPAPFRPVPDDQIYSPVRRNRRLFVEDGPFDSLLAAACFRDLDEPTELLELGTALFLDRPLGFAKAAGEPDQTMLFSHVMFSRTLAEHRLSILARRPGWLPDAGAIDRWRERLQTLIIDGMPLTNPGPPARPGVVSLHDALRTADDWVFLRTTDQTIRAFDEQYGSKAWTVSDWRLLVPDGPPDNPALGVYDLKLRKTMEFVVDMSHGYAIRGGMEFPAAGLKGRSIV
jgi:hypothetical protein